MCRFLSCFPWKNAPKQWWTSWRLLKSGSSRPNEWRYGAGAEADSGAGGGGNGFISFYLLSYICQRGRRVAGGGLHHLAGSPGGGGGYSGPVIL